MKETYLLFAFWCLILLLVGNLVCYLICLLKLSRINSFSELKKFEKKIQNKKFLHILFFSIQSVLKEIQESKKIYYHQIDLKAIAKEAEDYNKNINGLTTSEDEDKKS